MGKTGIARLQEEVAELEAKTPGLTIAEFLTLPVSLLRFLRWIVLNKAVTCEQAAAFLQEPENETAALVDELSAKGLMERLPICGEPRYRVCLLPRSIRPPRAVVELGQGEKEPWEPYQRDQRRKRPVTGVQRKVG